MNADCQSRNTLQKYSDQPQTWLYPSSERVLLQFDAVHSASRVGTKMQRGPLTVAAAGESAPISPKTCRYTENDLDQNRDVLLDRLSKSLSIPCPVRGQLSGSITTGAIQLQQYENLILDAVVMGDNVTIGMRSVTFPGVHIGNDVIWLRVPALLAAA
jgi:hypothetical protein